MRYLQYNTRFALKFAENKVEGFDILFLKCILDLIEQAPLKIEWPVLEEIICSFTTYAIDESYELLEKIVYAYPFTINIIFFRLMIQYSLVIAPGDTWHLTTRNTYMALVMDRSTSEIMDIALAARKIAK